MSKATPTAVNRQLLALSLPLAGTQLANIALAATDTAMMGQLSLSALAGGGLAVVWFNQVRTMAVGLLTPLGNVIAATHARDPNAQEEIRSLSRVGWVVATLSGALGVIILLGIGYALPYFGQSQEVAHAATAMMWMLAPGLIPCLWFQACRQFCVGLGKPKSLLGITLGMVAVNALLDYALGFGPGPFPDLGVMGIGLATSITHVLSALAYLWLIAQDPELHPLHAPFTARTHRLGSLLGTQLRLGLPVSATYGAEAGMFSVLAMVMGAIGAGALAAHNVVYQVTFIVFQIGVGFSHGSSILVSRAWGVGNKALARKAALHAQMIMTALVALCAVLFLSAPRQVLAPFMGGVAPSTIALAASLLAIGAVMEFVDTGQNIAIGVLRGIGDTTTGLKASLIGYWLIGLPLALVLAFPAGLGAHGVWWGLSAGLAASAAILWRTFLLKTRT